MWRLDDLEFDASPPNVETRSTAHARARAHVEEAQVRLVRPALRGEPLQEGDRRLAGRGRRVVGAPRAGGLAAPHAGGATAHRSRPLERRGAGDAPRPGAAQFQERSHQGNVRRPKWALGL